MTKTKQRNIIIAGLCSILVIMGIGYAAFAQQLNITGTSKISSSWDVEITNIATKNKVGTASNKSEPSYTSTTATFDTALVSPGDSITYDVTIENKGTIDAVLKTVTKTDTENTAIIFDTSGVKQGDVLKAGESTTYTVIVSYNSAVTSQPSDLTSELTVKFDYIQNDGNDYSIPEQTAAQMLIAKAVTSGDGIYADTYESGRYIYKGATPDNYITFNNETWRILSVESDGTIKIIRNEKIADKTFDSQGLRDSSSNGAGGTYCANGSYGCNAWAKSDSFTTYSVINGGTTLTGTVLKDAELNTYLNETYLNSIDSTKVVSHSWSVGAVDYYADANWNANPDLASQIKSENATTWNGKIALATMSEYIRANSNETSCGNLKLNNENTSTCQTTNWIYGIAKNANYPWLLSPYATDYSLYVFDVYGDGDASSSNANDSIGVVPVLYLSSDISLSGSGTSSDPYVLG